MMRPRLVLKVRASFGWLLLGVLRWLWRLWWRMSNLRPKRPIAVMQR